MRRGRVSASATLRRNSYFVCLRSPLSTLPARIIVPAFPQRSPPRHLIAAACGGLRSAPDCRTRRALLHLSYSCAPPILTSVLVSHNPCPKSGTEQCEFLCRGRSALFLSAHYKV